MNPLPWWLGMNETGRRHGNIFFDAYLRTFLDISTYYMYTFEADLFYKNRYRLFRKTPFCETTPPWDDRRFIKVFQQIINLPYFKLNLRSNFRIPIKIIRKLPFLQISNKMVLILMVLFQRLLKYLQNKRKFLDNIL